MSDDRSITRRALLQAAAGTAVAGSAGCSGITTPADLARAEDVARLPYFVDAAWLDDHRDDVVVLDARDRDSFRNARIYGARRPDFERATARRSTPDGRVPDAETIAGAFADAGVSPDDDVVVYGSSVGSRVTRLVFALEHLGHRGEINALDGGFEAWPGRLGTGSRTPDPGTYEPATRPETVATRAWIADRLGDDGPTLVDTRAPEAYLGARASSALDPANDRHGHLPGAIDVHWLGNVEGRRLKAPPDLAELYFAGAGIAEDDTVVVYGAGNVNPTNTYVVLKALGVSDVRLYDGGFGEWANVPEGQRDRYPVETKTTAVIEAGGDVGGGGSGDFSCSG